MVDHSRRYAYDAGTMDIRGSLAGGRTVALSKLSIAFDLASFLKFLDFGAARKLSALLT
jgi:hypothetical protein